jgi:hypothetical protein
MNNTVRVNEHFQKLYLAFQVDSLESTYRFDGIAIEVNNGKPTMLVLEKGLENEKN